ncbi:MAG TPA: hypothetical protein VLK22_01480 [Candidatus Udaeobacter sp.]|nr:hypothetical protein [Candidatus Udaeobacter sp.]
MKSRSLIKLFTCLVILVTVRTTWAEDKTDERRTWCSIYSQAQYLAGEFSGDSGAGNLDRKNLSLGVRCNYNRRSWLTLAMESAISYGTLDVSYLTSDLSGAAAYRTMGIMESLGASFKVHQSVELFVLAGVEIANANRFELQAVSYDFGNGPVDLTYLAAGRLSSNGRLEMGNVEAGVEIQSGWHNLSFIFGASYQRIHMVFRFNVDEETRHLLEILKVDQTKIVNRVIEKWANSGSLVPGIKWNGENFKLSFKLNGGLVKKNKWLFGGFLQAEIPF